MIPAPVTTDPVKAGALGRCPRCGKGKLFEGLGTFVDRCAVCDLDIGGFNVGDGAIVFLILILNTIGMGLALWLEFTFYPPFWVHVILWPPILVALTILGLRVGKGLLLGLEFRHEAAEGRLKE